MTILVILENLILFESSPTEYTKIAFLDLGNLKFFTCLL